MLGAQLLARGIKVHEGTIKQTNEAATIERGSRGQSVRKNKRREGERARLFILTRATGLPASASCQPDADADAPVNKEK